MLPRFATLELENILFSEWALKNGGTLFPIVFNANLIANKSLLNPSLSISEDGTGTFVFRSTNYRYLRPVRNLNSLTSTGSIQYLSSQTGATSNSFFLAHHDFPSNNLKTSKPIKIDRIQTPILPLSSGFDYSTVEDLRISRFEGRLILVGNIATTKGKRRPFYCEVDSINRDRNHFRLLNLQCLEISNMNMIEKNWVPIEGHYGKFVRWPMSLQMSGNRIAQVISIFQQELQTEIFIEQPNIYGGSQFVRYENGYMGVIHLRKNGIRKNNHQYLHKFFLYDKDFNFVKSSNSFSFLGFDTEFCSGLSIYKDKIYVSFSCNDSLNFVLSFNRSESLWEHNHDFK